MINIIITLYSIFLFILLIMGITILYGFYIVINYNYKKAIFVIKILSALSIISIIITRLIDIMIQK